jgi:hypothetical protein
MTKALAASEGGTGAAAGAVLRLRRGAGARVVFFRGM